MKALLSVPGYSDLHVSMPTMDHIFVSLIILKELFSSDTATILPSEVTVLSRGSPFLTAGDVKRNPRAPAIEGL